MATDRDKNVSCFTLDGVVAEMVIEVEDNQKYDDFKDLASPIKDLASSITDLASNKDLASSTKDINSSNEDVSENKVHDVEIVPENMLSEKREDKENIVDVSEILSMKDKIECEKSVKKDKKRKFEEISSYGDENEKNLDHPRYPGRKRQANKRYVSDDMITTIIDSSDNVQTKDTLKDDRKQKKVDTDFNDASKVTSIRKSSVDKSEKLALSEGIIIEKNVHSLKDESRDVKEDHHLIPDEATETEEPKQKILRKLPFRRNKDAPDVPDLKPKVFWWNGVGEGTGVKLGDLPEVRKKIEAAKSVRPLYRILFYQWPTNGQDIIAEILNFNGFPFNRESYEFTKRQSLLKIMFDRTIGNICDVLGIEKGSKTTMIDNILNFLLKPTGKIDPSIDPSMQPVVLLERIELDHKFFQSFEENVMPRRSSGRSRTNISTKARKDLSKRSPVVPVRTTRNSLSKLKAVEASSKMTSVKGKEDSKNTPVKTKLSSTREKDTLEVKGAKEKSVLGTKDSKVLSTGNKPKVAGKAKPVDEAQKSVTRDAPAKVKKVTQLKRKGKKSKYLSKNKMTRKSVDNSSKDKDSKKIDVDDQHSTVEENEMKEGDLHEPALTEKDESGLIKKELNLSTKVTTDILSDSSETESAEESKIASLSPSPKSSPRTTHKRKGKPLKMFPEISESIRNANFSALQRLHILLFGASDKAENLKGNILAFGGFPFLEGSDDWKQKHFLLSLLAQNNLREYLKLLCIQYSDDDQPTMINKLMQFLAAPTENAIENKPLETEKDFITPDVKNKGGEVQPKKSAILTKKNAKKKDKKPGKQRKILMSEEEARRLEASFAREQRALARDVRAHIPITPKSSATESSANSKQPITDPRQLNALLQTVYKRRALKAAGAVVSTPNKGKKVKLGDIENIKFLIVTANLQDLDVLHQLIYMMPANKSRVRKNILDFDGFGFNEDSEKYKQRMDLLNSLGYGVSKRLSFLLGLCPLHTDIPQQDLNELIMYFLMSPCKSKQAVPITQMPVDPTKLPEEGHVILNSSFEVDKISIRQSKSPTVPETSIKAVSETKSESLSSSITCQKAKKSFSSSQKLPTVKKVLLPPAMTSPAGKILNFNIKQPVGSIPKSVAVLNPVQAIPTFSIPKASTLNSETGKSLLSNPVNVAIVNSLKSPVVNTARIKVPVVNPNPKVQIINSATKSAVLDAATKIPTSNFSPIPGSIMQNRLILPGVSNKVNILPKPTVVPAPILPGSKLLMGSPVPKPNVMSSPQEFLIQQKTPDGKQKTFKLIRLLPNNPLASAVKSPVQQATQVQQQVIIGTSLSGNPLPPGIVVMKNNSILQLPGQNLQNVLQTVPVKVNLPIKPSSSVMTTSISNSDEFVLPDQGESANTSENDPDIEILNPLEDNPPTDNELFSSIQEIILSSNFEVFTLRNVIEKVSAQFPHHDLTHRHNFMKECVKKIIIGT